MYMEIVRSSRSLARVNENYAQDFEEGMEELDERFKVARMITPGLKYEVHMYVDQWPDWESAKVLSIKEISETQFEAQSVK